MGTRKPRLLIIVPSLGFGGQERVAFNTAEIMRDFYDITFVIFDNKDAVFKPNCELINLAIPASNRTCKRIFYAILRAKMIREIKKKKKVDISLSFGSTANLSNALSFGVGKTVVNIRGFDSVRKSLLLYFIYRKSHAIICCSQKMCDELAVLYPQYIAKIYRLYNPYDIESLMKRGEEAVLDYQFSLHTVIAHGRIEKVKNYPRLIKAFSLVRAALLDAQLLIIGEGTQRRQLEELIAAYNLKDSVRLIGFRKNPFAYLAKSTLYVLSSYSEGFPNALVEGMTFLPAVAVDCKTGPREILSDGPVERICRGWEDADYGVLVQPSDQREFCQALTEDDRILADAILSVLTNPQKAKVLQSRAQLRVKAFSYAAYRKNIQKILED